jgi:1-acylglycerone phosphate reductase
VVSRYCLLSGSAGYQAALIDTDLDAARKLFNVNVLGLVEVTKAFSRMLVASQGRIVNIGSIVSRSSVPFHGIYNASKAAVQMISNNMRIELAPFGVKVIHVVTGGIKTKFFDNIDEYDFPADSLYDPARKELEAAIKGDISHSVLTSMFDSIRHYAALAVRLAACD